MAPTVLPLTSTRASFTRWMTARIYLSIPRILHCKGLRLKTNLPSCSTVNNFFSRKNQAHNAYRIKTFPLLEKRALF
jgi:hypothetical protein